MRGFLTVFVAGFTVSLFGAYAASAQDAIPKPAAGQAAPKQPAKKKAKAAVKCEELFEAACREAGETCAWSAGQPGADGAPAKGSCIKVDKSAAKATKDSCPTMFEALCKETSGCGWTAGTPGADGKPGPGSCAYEGKGKKTASAKKQTVKATPPPAAAAAEPPPDAFTDQQAQ